MSDNERPDAVPPKEIFLQGGEGVDTISDRYWCQDRIDETDIRYVLAAPSSDAAQPTEEAKLAFIKAHTAIMGEWEVTDKWEEALDAGLRAVYAINAHPEDAPEEPTPSDYIEATIECCAAESRLLSCSEWGFNYRHIMERAQDIASERGERNALNREVRDRLKGDKADD